MEKLDQILDSYVGRGDKPGRDELLGAAFVVVSKDAILYQGAAGRLTSDADSPKFSTDSISWVASLTKLVTATCAMRIVEDGLIGLDDDVRPLVSQLAQAKILRGFVGADIPYLEENTTPITLRQLLTHTTGFGYANADPDLERWARHVNRDDDDVLRGTIADWETPLKFTPGQGWYYGTAIDWAGQVVEKVTGKTLGAYMTERVLEPLGMRDTSFAWESLAGDRLVPTAYRDPETGELATGARPDSTDGKVHGGGAGLYTTAADYARLLQALLLSSGGHGGVLRKDTVDEMFRPQLTDVQKGWLKFITDLFHGGMMADFEKGMPLDYGISGAINMEDSAGKRRKGSMMWAGLCNGHWFIDRETGIGAVFITNILPQPDPVVIKIWDDLERAVYSDLITA